MLGVGVGYFFVNGLEVGLDYEAWVAATPSLQRLSPEARYVFCKTSPSPVLTASRIRSLAAGCSDDFVRQRDLGAA